MKEFHLAAARLALAVICVAVSRAEVALSQATTRSLSRDSATIRLIEHPAVPRQPFGLRLAESPFLTLGGLHDDERREFAAGHFFLTAARLSDGRAVVLDEFTLKWFDAKGALLRVSGRRGPGPSEFRTTRDLCVLRGDTVMVMESYGGRISLWASTGKFIREYQRPSGFAPFYSCRSDGTLVVRWRCAAMKTVPSQRIA